MSQSNAALKLTGFGATSRPGVFVAGSATGPETIDDSIAQGHAAAMSAFAVAQGPVKDAAE